jgi:hypothetical protein
MHPPVLMPALARSTAANQLIILIELLGWGRALLWGFY